MDRCVVFVDAGYLLAEGGKLACGTSTRSDLYLDFEVVGDFLADLCSDHCGLPHLRTYWYDGWWEGNPNPAHLKLSYQRGIKLRLGRLTRSGQKGVDSRIVRDLIVLSHNRSMQAAYLLGGDEDLREGVEAAQEWGVPVTLIGVEPEDENTGNQSGELVRSVDDYLTLTDEQLSEFMWLKEGREPVGTDAGEAFGQAFAESWQEGADDGLVEAVQAQQPRIPRSVDAQLMERAEDELGPVVQHDEPLRRAVRAGFWTIVGE